MIRSSRTLVVIYPPPPYWHAHRKGYAWLLCTDRWCEKPYDLAESATAQQGETP